MDRFLQLTDGEPLGGQAAAHGVFFAGPRTELGLNRGEIMLGGGALGGRSLVLALRLRRAAFRLQAFIGRRLPPRAGVAQSLGRKRDIALQPADFQLGVAEPALDFGASRLTRVPRLDARFTLALRIGQPRACRRQRFGQLAGPYAERPERQIEVLELAPHERQRDAEPLFDHLAIALGTAPLTRETTHLRLHFADQVLEPGEIGSGFLEPPFRALLAIAIQADARCFFEQGAALFGLLRQQRLDHLRFHHDRGIGAETGPAQHVLDVAQPHGRTVQLIVALPGARETARDDDLLIGDREAAVRVVEDQRHLRHVHGPASRRTLEDDVFHFATAQEARRLFAQHPAHRVGDVRLAAAVWSHDRGHALLERQLHRSGERFESGQLEPAQSHGVPMRGSRLARTPARLSAACV